MLTLFIDGLDLSKSLVDQTICHRFLISDSEVAWLFDLALSPLSFNVVTITAKSIEVRIFNIFLIQLPSFC